MPHSQLDHETLVRMHKLSALHIPPKDSKEYENMKAEMENLVRLVDAVQLIELPEEAGSVASRLRDGDHAVSFSEYLKDRKVPEPVEDPENTGTTLLKHSKSRNEHFYVVPRT